MRLRLSWLPAWWFLLGCMDPTQATIDVTTNVGCGAESPSPDTLYETGIVAGPPLDVDQGELQATTRACEPRDDGTAHVGSIVIYPRDGAEQAGVLVLGTVGDVSAESCLQRVRSKSTELAGCIVARRTVAFVPQQDLHVSVLLDGRCEGIVCAEDETCVFAGGKPTCVPADVACVGSACDVPTTSGTGGAGPTGAGGGSVTTGSGGAGGAGGATFEPLPSPTALLEAQAMGVSEDGQVVVGIGRGAGSEFHPVVWRAQQALELGTAPGAVYEACGAGDVVVGAQGASGAHATAWKWNAAAQTYGVLWTLAAGTDTSATDCSVTGNRILTTGGVGGFELHSLGSQTALDSELASAFELSANGGVVVGSTPATSFAAYWPVSQAGVLSAPVELSTSNGIGFAVNANGTLVAASVGDDLVVFEVGNATPVFLGAPGFVAEAIAGPPSDWIVVGSCDTFVEPRACVVVNGQGPFDVDGLMGTPWSTTASLDFGGLKLVTASDVSADGKVVVGWGTDPSTTRQVAYRLTLP